MGNTAEPEYSVSPGTPVTSREGILESEGRTVGSTEKQVYGVSLENL